MSRKRNFSVHPCRVCEVRDEREAASVAPGQWVFSLERIRVRDETRVNSRLLCLIIIFLKIF